MKYPVMVENYCEDCGTHIVDGGWIWALHDMVFFTFKVAIFIFLFQIIGLSLLTSWAGIVVKEYGKVSLSCQKEILQKIVEAKI